MHKRIGIMSLGGKLDARLSDGAVVIAAAHAARPNIQASSSWIRGHGVSQRRIGGRT